MVDRKAALHGICEQYREGRKDSFLLFFPFSNTFHCWQQAESPDPMAMDDQRIHKTKLSEMFCYQMKMGPPGWSQSASQANGCLKSLLGSIYMRKNKQSKKGEQHRAREEKTSPSHIRIMACIKHFGSGPTRPEC